MLDYDSSDYKNRRSNMKVMIMTDLEGPAGINGRSDGIGNKTMNPPIACQVLMDEVNACVRGLVKGGADEIVVWDGHGGSNSMDITKLQYPAHLGTIGGDLAPCVYLDASFDAAIALGFHAMEGVADGYMNHSYDSHHICNMWINGELIGEIGMTFYEAAYFGVPMILVTGDQAACREAKAFMPDVKTVCTKNSLSRYTTINRNPTAVQNELEATAEAAIRKLKSFKTKKLPKEFVYRIQLMCPNTAISYEKIGWERIDPFTIETRGADFVDVFSRYLGWAAGVHNRRFGISPSWTGLCPPEHAILSQRSQN